MNLAKSVILQIKERDLSEKNYNTTNAYVTYLGVVTDKNEQNCSSLNFQPIIQQIQYVVDE